MSLGLDPELEMWCIWDGNPFCSGDPSFYKRQADAAGFSGGPICCHFSRKIPKIKPCQESSLSLLVTPHVSRLLANFLWRAHWPGKHPFLFWRIGHQERQDHMVPASTPAEGRMVRIDPVTFIWLTFNATQRKKNETYRGIEEGMWWIQNGLCWSHRS